VQNYSFALNFSRKKKSKNKKKGFFCSQEADVMSEYSDERLLELFRDEKNRHEVFSRIVAQYKERLYWHIRKILISHEDTDDVLQNTFVKAWTGLGTFRGESKLYTWLYRIATNESVSFLNNRKNTLLSSEYDMDSHPGQYIESDAYFSGDELQAHLQRAILDLPEKQRIVFNMKYFDDMPYEEMSEILDTSVGALKASYHHAVKKIKMYLERII
jgi:RNA polymerase sigma-70 factor (ECF subfamily)